MPYFIKESIIVKLALKFIYIVNMCYKNSKLKKIADRISYIVLQSAIFNSLKRYVNKNPAFLNSISYRFIRVIVKFVNYIADKIHMPFALMINKSNFKEKIQNIKNADIKMKFHMLSLFIIAISMGFVIGNIFLEQISSQNVGIGLALVLISLIIIFCNKNLNIIKNSLIYRFIEYLIQ